MTPSSEIAEKLWEMCIHSTGELPTENADDCIKAIAEAIDQARKEAVEEDRKTHNNRVEKVVKDIRKEARKEALQELKNACNEAENEGFKKGLERAAEIIEGDVLISPNEFDSHTKLKVFDLLLRIAQAIREGKDIE